MSDISNLTLDYKPSISGITISLMVDDDQGSYVLSQILIPRNIFAEPAERKEQ